MKKILFMFILFIPIFVYAEDISISSFELSSTSGLGKIVDNPSYNGLDINISNEFYNVGDSVTYDLVMKDMRLE